MNKLLVVDDDPHIRELVRHFLGSAGLTVLEAADGRQALQLFKAQKIDLVVLDIMMPQIDGWHVCREIKRLADVPIVLLTAMGETARKLRGFELGADDYLVKPFDPLELVARVKMLLKRYKIESAQTVQIGLLRMDKQSFEIKSPDQIYTIPLKEFELLFKLGASPGTTFTRDQLIGTIWGQDFEGTERTVDVHINRLRDRFPEANFGFRIVSIRGLGYRLEVI